MAPPPKTGAFTVRQTGRDPRCCGAFAEQSRQSDSRSSTGAFAGSLRRAAAACVPAPLLHGAARRLAPGAGVPHLRLPRGQAREAPDVVPAAKRLQQHLLLGRVDAAGADHSHPAQEGGARDVQPLDGEAAGEHDAAPEAALAVHVDGTSTWAPIRADAERLLDVRFLGQPAVRVYDQHVAVAEPGSLNLLGVVPPGLRHPGLLGEVGPDDRGHAAVLENGHEVVRLVLLVRHRHAQRRAELLADGGGVARAPRRSAAAFVGALRVRRARRCAGGRGDGLHRALGHGEDEAKRGRVRVERGGDGIRSHEDKTWDDPRAVVGRYHGPPPVREGQRGVVGLQGGSGEPAHLECHGEAGPAVPHRHVPFPLGAVFARPRASERQVRVASAEDFDELINAPALDDLQIGAEHDRDIRPVVYVARRGADRQAALGSGPHASVEAAAKAQRDIEAQGPERTTCSLQRVVHHVVLHGW
mmetsp:Transcript_6255/g.17921  ORF Transcript_6255/g.17921 Transcript_6255/m.17921 type:complete len:471 (+) Transcript_6255:259-1671(+)